MDKATRKYILFMALAVICFDWKTLLTNQYTMLAGSEGVNQTYAWLHYWLRSVWHFDLPAWDPYVFAGRPFAGETQTTAYYPFRLLFALVPWNRHGVISPHFYHEYLAFVRFCGGLFMFALLRELGRSRFASFLGGCAFTMGGLPGRLPWPMHMEACTWLPASLLFVVRSLRPHQNSQRALMEASLAGLCLGLSILTGGIQFAMMQGICTVLAILYFGLVHRHSEGSRVDRRRVAVVLSALVITGVAIGGVQLVPSFEYGHNALRFIKGGWHPITQKIPYDRMDNGIGPQSLLTGIFPTGGGPTDGEFWPYYVGVLPFFLAAWAAWRCLENVRVRFFIGLAVFSFVYALGEFFPLNGILYSIVPYLWTNREPSRFLYLASFSVAGLAAFGIDNLLARGADVVTWPRATPVLKWIAIVTAAAMVLPGVLTQVTVGAWTYLSLILVVASCGWLWYLIGKSPSRSTRLLLAAFIVLDLGAFNWNASGSAAVVQAGDQYEQMLTLRAPAEFIKSQPGIGRVRVAVSPEPNIGDMYGVQSVWGAGVTVLENYTTVSPRESLLNVRYRVKPASTPDAGAIYQDTHWKVYKDDTAFPRAWLVHRTAVVNPKENIFVQADRMGADLHNVALVESALPQTLEASGSRDSIHLTNYADNSMALDVNAGGKGLLVLSELFYPGWKSTVNGKRVEIYKVDGGLRAIPVDRGGNRVVLSYAPVSLYVSAGISFVTMLVCCWFGFRLYRSEGTIDEQVSR